MEILKAEIKTFNIKQEGDRVIFLCNGRLVFSMPHDAAEVIGRAILSQAKRAEEYARAETIALDSAIMLRAGAPFILSDRRDILTEAQKLAAWDSQLRRYMPDRGIKSQEVFGCPVVINHPPKEVKNDAN